MYKQRENAWLHLTQLYTSRGEVKVALTHAPASRIYIMILISLCAEYERVLLCVYICDIRHNVIYDWAQQIENNNMLCVCTLSRAQHCPCRGVSAMH